MLNIQVISAVAYIDLHIPADDLLAQLKDADIEDILRVDLTSDGLRKVAQTLKSMR